MDKEVNWLNKGKIVYDLKLVLINEITERDAFDVFDNLGLISKIRYQDIKIHLNKVREGLGKVGKIPDDL